MSASCVEMSVQHAVMAVWCMCSVCTVCGVMNAQHDCFCECQHFLMQMPQMTVPCKLADTHSSSSIACIGTSNTTTTTSSSSNKLPPSLLPHFSLPPSLLFIAFGGPPPPSVPAPGMCRFWQSRPQAASAARLPSSAYGPRTDSSLARRACGLRCAPVPASVGLAAPRSSPSPRDDDRRHPRQHSGRQPADQRAGEQVADLRPRVVVLQVSEVLGHPAEILTHSLSPCDSARRRRRPRSHPASGPSPRLPTISRPRRPRRPSRPYRSASR